MFANYREEHVLVLLSLSPYVDDCLDLRTRYLEGGLATERQVLRKYVQQVLVVRVQLQSQDQSLSWEVDHMCSSFSLPMV